MAGSRGRRKMWMRDEMPGRRANGPLVSDMGFDSSWVVLILQAARERRKATAAWRSQKQSRWRAQGANEWRGGVNKLEGVDGVGGRKETGSVWFKQVWARFSTKAR